jgi:hypothetical protein
MLCYGCLAMSVRLEAVTSDGVAIVGSYDQ